MENYENTLPPREYGDKMQIIVDENEYIGGWWRSMSELELTYTRDRSDNFFSPGVAMYKDNELVGYATANVNQLRESRYGREAFERYLELHEFALQLPGEGEELITYFRRYAGFWGAKFILVKTQENFPGFYRFLTKYFGEKVDGCYLIESLDYVEYEKYSHLRSYPEDKLSFDDINVLSSFCFNVGRDKCFIGEKEGRVEIDRHSGKIQLPYFIYSEEELVFGPKLYSFAFMLSRELEELKKKGFAFRPLLDDPLGAGLLGEEEAVVFSHIEEDREAYLKVLKKLKSGWACKILRVYSAKMSDDGMWPCAVFYQRNIDKAIGLYENT